MENFQINIRSELIPTLRSMAAKEGCPIEAIIELIIEERLSEIRKQST